MITKEEYKKQLMVLYEFTTYNEPSNDIIRNGLKYIDVLNKDHYIMIPIVPNNNGSKPPFELILTNKKKSDINTMLYNNIYYTIKSIGGGGMYSRLEELIQIDMIKLCEVCTHRFNRDNYTYITTYYIYKKNEQW